MLRAKSQCHGCWGWGHWQGDPSCPLSQAKKQPALPRKRISYFVVANKEDKANATGYMVLKNTGMLEPCGHARNQEKCVQRGGSATTRRLTCGVCKSAVYQLNPFEEGSRWRMIVYNLWWLKAAVGLWRDAARRYGMSLLSDFKGALKKPEPEPEAKTKGESIAAASTDFA